MIKECFNTGWQYWKGVAGVFAPAGPLKNANLPVDVMLFEKRTENCVNGNATGFYPGGTYTFRKKFFVPEEDREKETCFEFEGVYMNASVYINGGYSGKQAYGYSNFYINAGSQLNYGQENELTVIVKNGAEPNTRWYSGSGIYRNVNIIKADLLHTAMDGIRITTKSIETKCAVVQIRVKIENHSKMMRKFRLKLTVKNNNKNVKTICIPMSMFGDTETVITQNICVENPTLWSIDQPELYSLECMLEENNQVIDFTTEQFGIRMLCLDSINGFRINGKEIKIRGTCLHHDNGVIGAATFEKAEWRRARIIKEAGFNAIRSAHQPLSKAMLKACDCIGLLVLDEAYDVWTYGKSDYDYALNFEECWEKELASMVAKDYNHPSVVFYSIGNEISEITSPKGNEWNRKLTEKVHQLDNTRFVTNGVNGFFAVIPFMDAVLKDLKAEGKIGDLIDGKDHVDEINQFMQNFSENESLLIMAPKLGELLEETYAPLDIAGYNYMVERYENDVRDYPDRIILGTETCPPDIVEIWDKVKKNKSIIGDFTWIGYDYLGEAGCGAFVYDPQYLHSFFKPYPAILAFSGDIDITGFRRPMSYYREIAYGLRKDPYIAVQRLDKYGQKAGKTKWCGNDVIASWTWPGYEGKNAVIEIYSDSEEVELFLNGKSLGRKIVGEKKANMAFFETKYEKGTLLAISYKNEKFSGRTELKTAGIERKLSIKTEDTTILANGTDICYIPIEITDEEGILNMSEDILVKMEMEGPAELAGFGSAAPFTTESFVNKQHHTFDGRALAVIRSTGEEGTVQIKFSADTFDSVIVKIECKNQFE